MNKYPEDSIKQAGSIKTVVCEEKGRRFILHNDAEKHIFKIHVDGGLIKDGCRCDYAVDVSFGESVYLIELKGKDKEHAFEQLLKTLEYFSENFDTKNYHCRVVLSKNKVPNIKGKFEKLMLKAQKEKKCIDYDYACNVYDKDSV